MLQPLCFLHSRWNSAIQFFNCILRGLPLAGQEFFYVVLSDNVSSNVLYALDVFAAEVLSHSSGSQTCVTLAGLIACAIQCAFCDVVCTCGGDTCCYDDDIITSCSLASFNSTGSLVGIIGQNDSVQIITETGDPVSNYLTNGSSLESRL